MAAVPVAALTESFSPRPLMAPPPFGRETDGRRSVALAGLFVGAEVALCVPLGWWVRPGAPAAVVAVWLTLPFFPVDGSGSAEISLICHRQAPGGVSSSLSPLR